GTVVLQQEQHGKIVIPQKATFDLQASTFVKKLTDQNRVVRQKIRIENSVPNNRYIVSQGLHVGDRIIVGGLNRVTDSVRIKPMPYQPDTLVAPKVLPSKNDTAAKDSF